MKPKQCRSHDRMKDLQCQGMPKHKGPHWAYDAAGHLIRWANKKEKDLEWKRIAVSWTPPGHKSYISPEEMDKYQYLTIWVKEERRRRRESRRSN